MKKNLSLISAILMVNFTMCLFMPIIFEGKYMERLGYPHIGAGLKWADTYNIFGYDAFLLPTLIITFSILSIIVLFLQFLGFKNNILSKCNYLPGLTCLLFVFYSVCWIALQFDRPNDTATMGSNYQDYFKNDANWEFFIPLVFVIFSAAIISFFIAIGKIKDDEQEMITSSMEQLSNADELKKFMELLDGGVITQEEFEMKKKQLLDL